MHSMDAKEISWIVCMTLLLYNFAARLGLS